MWCHCTHPSMDIGQGVAVFGLLRRTLSYTHNWWVLQKASSGRQGIHGACIVIWAWCMRHDISWARDERRWCYKTVFSRRFDSQGFQSTDLLFLIPRDTSPLLMAPVLKRTRLSCEHQLRRVVSVLVHTALCGFVHLLVLIYDLRLPTSSLSAMKHSCPGIVLSSQRLGCIPGSVIKDSGISARGSRVLGGTRIIFYYCPLLPSPITTQLLLFCLTITQTSNLEPLTWKKNHASTTRWSFPVIIAQVSAGAARQEILYSVHPWSVCGTRFVNVMGPRPRIHRGLNPFYPYLGIFVEPVPFFPLLLLGERSELGIRIDNFLPFSWEFGGH